MKSKRNESRTIVREKVEEIVKGWGAKKKYVDGERRVCAASNKLSRLSPVRS